MGTKGKFWVYNSDWQEVFFAVWHDNFYFLKPSKYVTQFESANIVSSANTVNTHRDKSQLNALWRECFCHINQQYFLDTSKNSSVRGLSILTEVEEHCIPCTLEKSKSFV